MRASPPLLLTKSVESMGLNGWGSTLTSFSTEITFLWPFCLMNQLSELLSNGLKYHCNGKNCSDLAFGSHLNCSPFLSLEGCIGFIMQRDGGCNKRRRSISESKWWEVNFPVYFVPAQHFWEVRSSSIPGWSDFLYFLWLPLACN